MTASNFGAFLYILGVVLGRANGTIVTSKYSKVNQENTIDLKLKSQAALSVYCGPLGCQIRLGNDLRLRHFTSQYFVCSGNDERACGLSFAVAQTVLEELIAKRDVIYLRSWLKTGDKENAVFFNEKDKDRDTGNYPRYKRE